MSKLEIYNYIFESRYAALFFKLLGITFKSAFTAFCKGIKEVIVNFFCLILNILCLLLWFIIIPCYRIQGKKITKTVEYQRYARMRRRHNENETD